MGNTDSLRSKYEKTVQNQGDLVFFYSPEDDFGAVVDGEISIAGSISKMVEHEKFRLISDGVQAKLIELYQMDYVENRGER